MIFVSDLVQSQMFLDFSVKIINSERYHNSFASFVVYLKPRSIGFIA